MFSIDIFTVGIPGLDTKILSWIDLDNHSGVVLAPSDPWFIFSPAILPAISTEFVRQYNLKASDQKWYYWLPFDYPYDVYQWRPQWDGQTKRFLPLTASGFPYKLPVKQHPSLFHKAKHHFLNYWKDETPEESWPLILTSRNNLP